MGTKFIKVRVENLKEGDIVKSNEGGNHYIILNKFRTFLHHHIYYEVMYLDGVSKKYYIEDIKEEGDFRKVLRLNMGNEDALDMEEVKE